MAVLAAELEGIRHGSVQVLQADLRAFDRLPELVATTVGHYGRLDALVNNASAFYPTLFDTTTPQQWDDLFAVNARAPFFLAQAAAPHLCAARGAVVNLGRSLRGASARRPRDVLGDQGRAGLADPRHGAGTGAAREGQRGGPRCDPVA